MIKGKIVSFVQKLSLLSVIFLASCSNARFVVDKDMLDPLSITVQQSVALPPAYYLSSPEISDQRRILRSNRQNAAELFLPAGSQTNSVNNSANTNTQLTNNDLEFLVLAKANSANSDIRETLNAEVLAQVKKDKNFINKIFSTNNDYLDPSIVDYKNNTANKK